MRHPRNDTIELSLQGASLATQIIEGEERWSEAERKYALETTQGQIDGFFSQLPFKCYLPEVASVGH